MITGFSLLLAVHPVQGVPSSQVKAALSAIEIADPNGSYLPTEVAPLFRRASELMQAAFPFDGDYVNRLSRSIRQEIGGEGNGAVSDPQSFDISAQKTQYGSLVAVRFGLFARVYAFDLAGEPRATPLLLQSLRRTFGDWTSIDPKATRRPNLLLFDATGLQDAGVRTTRRVLGVADTPTGYRAVLLAAGSIVLSGEWNGLTVKGGRGSVELLSEPKGFMVFSPLEAIRTRSTFTYGANGFGKPKVQIVDSDLARVDAYLQQNPAQGEVLLVQEVNSYRAKDRTRIDLIADGATMHFSVDKGGKVTPLRI